MGVCLTRGLCQTPMLPEALNLSKHPALTCRKAPGMTGAADRSRELNRFLVATVRRCDWTCGVSRSGLESALGPGPGPMSGFYVDVWVLGDITKPAPWQVRARVKGRFERQDQGWD